MSEAMARRRTPQGGASPAPRSPGARAIDAAVIVACWAAVSGIALAALPPAASSRFWAVLAPVVGAVWVAVWLVALRRSRARQATRVVQVCLPAALVLTRRTAPRDPEARYW